MKNQYQYLFTEHVKNSASQPSAFTKIWIIKFPLEYKKNPTAAAELCMLFSGSRKQEIIVHCSTACVCPIVNRHF